MKKALILTFEKFQDHEVIYPYYALKEHGFDVTVAGNCPGERMNGILGAFINCDIHVKDLYNQDNSPDNFDLLMIPGGVKALEKLRLEEKAVRFVKEWFDKDKFCMCICNGAQLLITADVLRGGLLCAGYYSIEPDILNAGGNYSKLPSMHRNLVSCAHYDDMGAWMRMGMKEYANRNQPKTVGE